MTTRDEKRRTYICIDLKTFYASVECAERGRDPFTTNLVVADPDRGTSTICLAVSPAMKRLGVRNRCRVFEIPPGIDYIMAKPRMRRYMEVSAQIYGIYLEYVSAEDIHVYSIDECFIDATAYLPHYGVSAEGLARNLMDAVRRRCGICATAGIGPNLFLAKVALDICAKNYPDGIGVLDEQAFRDTVWTHRPITDIWGIGPGIARRLANLNVHDLRGVAALDERVLYREFGVNAEYLIDHAHGREPCTIAEIHAYRPEAASTTSGQVLARAYSYEEAYTVLREMVHTSVLDLVEKQAVCEQVSLFVGYANDARTAARIGASGTAQFVDGCGTRRLSTEGLLPDRVAGPGERAAPSLPPRAPRPAAERRPAAAAQGAPAAMPGEVFRGEHGARTRAGRRAYGYAETSRKLGERTNSFRRLMGYFDVLWSQTVDADRPIKRINIGFGNLLPEDFATTDLFSDPKADGDERKLARTLIAVHGKYGKNSLLKGVSLRTEATGRERNEQVGGHHA